MIFKGSQRSGAADLASHLTNLHDNDHVEIIALDGFIADDLHGAFQEIQAVAQATQCRQYLFSLSLNPPADFTVSDADFIAAADRIGKGLGLDDQPRAIVVHEKEGRRHAHAVWSRIDADTMTAINLPFFKMRLRDLSKELFLDHGWDLPPGLQTYGGKNPLNFTLAEWQQAKRQGVDPREIKQVFRQAWERSDSLFGLRNALAEHGYVLAKGDRRGIVAVDVQGEVYSLARFAGVKAKDVRAKCGSGEDLDGVEDVKRDLRRKVSGQMKDFIGQVKVKHAKDLAPLADERDTMVVKHRAERQRMKDKQTEREAAEIKTRMARLNTGVRGLLDRVTGVRSKVQDQNLREAMQALKRDQAQRDDLIWTQMQERHALQRQVAAKRKRHAEDRKIMARDVAGYLKRLENTLHYDQDQRQRDRSRRNGPSLGR